MFGVVGDQTKTSKKYPGRQRILKEVILYFVTRHTMYVCVFYIISICIVYCIFTTRRHTIIKDQLPLVKNLISYPTPFTPP